MTVDKIVDYLKGKKNVLIMAGALCEQVELDGKKLVDYVVEIAKKIGAPIAATGNTSKLLMDKEVRMQKMWAAEIPFYIKYGWNETLMEECPEVLVFIGYLPYVERALVTAVDVDTIVLDNHEIKEATLSFSDFSPEEWKENLENLISKL
ncbi:MAG: hypothetical protein ACXQT5_04770 [Candidatus Syntropharchaeia archaeon]